MTAPDPLRESVLAAVKARGVPQVAREVDVHHQTLRKYLNGGRVRGDVLVKLGEWANPSPSGLREAGPYRGSGL